jgi:hypothetical protein
LAQYLAVPRYGLNAIATIGVDVKLSIVALAIASLSGCAKGDDLWTDFIEMKYWFYHVLNLFACKITKNSKL